MRNEVFTTCLLILASHTMIGQTVAPAASSSSDWGAESSSSIEQWEKNKSPQPLAPNPRCLLTATKVFVVGEPPLAYPTNKAEVAFKKALVKWGRFQLVDDADTADLIIIISEYSSSKPKRVERISENVAIFVGGNAQTLDATPLWAVKESGPALGQRPTGKLVEDLRKYLTTLEQSVAASSVLSPT